MQINETFGECLKKLMKVLNLNGSVLAKGINVDSSLIYKWVRNERVPSYSSSHIDSISDYFVKCIINSFQQEKVISVLEECGFQISEGELIDILNAIRKYLFESQGYSIEIFKNKTINEKVKAPLKVKNSLKTLNTPFSVISNACGQTSIDNNHAYELSELNIPDDSSWDSENVKIIKGNNDVLYSALSLLQSAPSKPDNKDDEILIALNSSTNFMHNYKEYNVQWRHVLFRVLNKGWTIIILLRLNDDRKNIFKIIEDMQFALSIGKYRIYYYNKNDEFAVNELIVVPKRGALYCFSSRIKNQVDSAFLFKSKQSIKLLSEHFCQSFSSAKPLLHAYPSQISTEFQHKLTTVEENLGDRYVFKGGISTITIPMNLYEKYLEMSKKPKEETLLRLNYHRRRLDAFKNQIKYYKYKDIWFKEPIERLVSEKKYSFDKYYLLENNIPDDKDIVCHLENAVYMLERYENYEIAIVNENNYENISEMCWMIKENSSVLIETFNSHIQRKTKDDYYNSEINISISEKEVINAFRDYFIMIWSEISYHDKQKEEVINWLKNQIDLLKSRTHI